MTQPIFREILDEDGNPTGQYEQIEDVFKEVVVHDKRYKKATDDAYQNRQTIKELTAQLSTTEDSEDNAQVEPEEAEAEEVATTPEPAPAPINRDELYEEFRQRMREEEQEQANRQAMVERIGRDNNVNPALLRGQTEEELTKHAQLIAQEQLKFRDIGASPDGQATIDEGLWNRIDNRFGWGEE